MEEVFDATLDERLQRGFIDIDEMRTRETSDGEKYEYRYMHGGIKDTSLKFSFFFPKAEDYEGRFYQEVSPFPGPDEELAPLQFLDEDDWALFAMTHGAYFVESNMGSSAVFGNTEETPMNSALTAEYSRIMAQQVYGYEHRPFGYIFGGSGGGYRTTACVENTNAFDGAIPYIIGSPYAIPNCQSTRVYAMRILRNKKDQIMDALEPGGSGDPYACLNEEEAAVLREVELFGFPLKSFFSLYVLGDGAYQVLLPGVKQMDPDYFTKFWTEEGYLGADPMGNAVRDRIHMKAKVTEVYIPGKKEDDGVILSGANDSYKKMISDGGAAGEAWIAFDLVPTGDNLYLEGVNLMIETGAAAGKWLRLKRIEGNRIILGEAFGLTDMLETMELLKAGDEVMIDNSDYIAMDTFHRHQVPPADFHGWDQYRNADGTPIYPQEPMLVGPIFSSRGPGCKQNGRPNGKIMIVACLMDEQAYPWQADWYRRKIAAEHPGEKEEDLVRLYYFDHSLHDNRAETVDELHVTTYLSGLRQALLDLAQWTEKKTEPLPSSNYEINVGQVLYSDDVNERGGMQCIPVLTADGEKCAHVSVGQAVTFEMNAKVSAAAGKLTKVEFSFEGEQDYPYKGELEVAADGLSGRAVMEHSFSAPGTYFPAVRVYSERNGDKDARFTNIRNLDRVRIIVE